MIFRSRTSELNLRLFSCILALPLGGGKVFADNPLNHNGVSRINAPYVQALEREIELHALYQSDGNPREDGLLRQSISYGVSLSDRVFAEAYLKRERVPGRSFELSAYEIEAKIQLTEQGEYGIDWGVLIEYEREFRESIAELGAVLIGSKQVGSWVATVNAGIEYEFGSNIKNEIDTSLAAQWRYRYRETFEPGVEFYADEFTRGIGPMISGLLRARGKKKWHWEAGLILPLNATTADNTLRFLLEYEF